MCVNINSASATLAESSHSLFSVGFGAVVLLERSHLLFTKIPHKTVTNCSLLCLFRLCSAMSVFMSSQGIILLKVAKIKFR